MPKLSKAKKVEMLNKAASLIEEADRLMQKALGADDEVYYIHTQLENAKDDIVDFIINLDTNPVDA
jgi:hypothetical protein